MTSKTVAQTSTVAADTTISGTRRRIKPLNEKEFKTKLRDVRTFLQRVSKGLSPIPCDNEYVEQTKALAEEILNDIAEFEKMYVHHLGQTETKRSSGIKPRLCDKRLTTFLSNEFDVYLPELGKYGICDLNSQVLRAISLYVKQHNLGPTQFFTPDEKLSALFKSPSVNDPSKTYLELGHQRIAELSSERAILNSNNKDYKTPSAVAEIIEKDGQITMNYSALKIIVSKFAVEYELTDADKYLAELKEFSDILQKKHEQYESAKKDAKKKTATK